MFDLGFWELLLIGVVALLVVGPERLPALASTVGQWVGRMRRFVNHMRHEIQQELETEHLKGLVEEQSRELQSLKREVADVRDDTDAVTRETREEVGALEKEAAPEAGGRSAQPAAQGSARQSATQQSTAQKAAARKTTAKKASAKKSTAKKAAAKKSTAKKSAKKSARKTGADAPGGAAGKDPDETAGGQGGGGGRR